LPRIGFKALSRILPDDGGKSPRTNTKVTFKEALASDFSAGLVVFLVALPLCLGIALASNAPLFSGIIAGIVGGLVVGSLSGSPLSVSGPAAGLTVIVALAIGDLGSFNVFLTAVVLAGCIQFVLGIIKAGVIGLYFPSSVIKGMLAAIGLTLILKQLPHALGYDKDVEGDFSFQQVDGENTFTEIVNSINNLQWEAMIIALASVIVILFWDMPFMKRGVLGQIRKFLPGPLIAVLIGSLINTFFNGAGDGLVPLSGDHLVKLPVVSSITDFPSLFQFPDFNALGNKATYVTAITLAIVASLESLLSLEATDKLDPLNRISPPNRELRAQGIGNIVSGLIGGLPVTAVIVRSSANVDAGGKTKLSAIIHGVLLSIAVLILPRLLNNIPLASLAAVLILTGYKLAKVSLFRDMAKLGPDQYLPFFVTVVAILFSDLLKGVGIGMVVAIFFILRNNYKLPYRFDPRAHKADGRILLELSEDVTFLNKGAIILTLESIPEGSHLVIDGTRTIHIDYDVLEIIYNFQDQAPVNNIKLELIRIPKIIRVRGH